VSLDSLCIRIGILYSKAKASVLNTSERPTSGSPKCLPNVVQQSEAGVDSEAQSCPNYIFPPVRSPLQAVTRYTLQMQQCPVPALIIRLSHHPTRVALSCTRLSSIALLELLPGGEALPIQPGTANQPA
jgi:hypothetical protein